MTLKRPLNVLITLMGEEHRIQVNGHPESVSEIVRLSKPSLAKRRYDLASGLEQKWHELPNTCELPRTGLRIRLAVYSDTHIVSSFVNIPNALIKTFDIAGD